MFSWIPSGALKEYLTFNIWIKPKAQAKQFEMLSFSSEKVDEPNPTRPGTMQKTTIIHAPHADIIFDNQRRTATDRTADGYHLVKVGPYEDGSILQGKLEWVMASAHYLNPEQGNFANKAGLKMIADSGGAQMKKRTANFVDPHHVIETYNACADYGMSLDVPPRFDVDGQNKKALEILALVQRKNNEIFKAKRRPDLGLLNVVHGVTSDDIRRWAEIVNDPTHFQGWAVGSDSSTNPESVYKAASILYREFGIKENQQWLHLFGVSGPRSIPVMAWLGRYIPCLTSDSSSYLEGARRRTYFTTFGGAVRSIGTSADLRTKNFGDSPWNNESLLPCPCEFCTMMKYFGTIGMSREAPQSYPAIIGHDLLALRHAANEWNALAATLDLKQYTKLVSKNVSPESALYCEYVESLVQDGVDYADKHYSRFLNASGALHGDAVMSRTNKQMTRIPLFAINAAEKKEEGLIGGLSVEGSNLELIPNYLDDTELHDILVQFGFDMVIEDRLKAARAKFTPLPQGTEAEFEAEVDAEPPTVVIETPVQAVDPAPIAPTPEA
jgi:hypothetical protein